VVEEIPAHLRPDAYLAPPDGHADGDIDDDEQMMMINDHGNGGWDSAAANGPVSGDTWGPSPENAATKVTPPEVSAAIKVSAAMEVERVKLGDERVAIAKERAELEQQVERAKLDAERAAIAKERAELEQLRAQLEQLKHGKAAGSPGSDSGHSQGYTSDGDDFDIEANVEEMFKDGTDLTLLDCLAKGMSETTFREIDADSSGTLSRKEFSDWQSAKQVNSDGYVSDGSDFNIEADFNSMLTDSDLTLEDCLAHGMPEALFRQIDADNNGTLSKQEFAEWQKLSGRAQPAEFNSDSLDATTEKENPYSEVRVFQGAGVVRRGSHFASDEAVEPEGEEDAAVNEIASSLMSQ
jgi:Ca2+-binding EF-hand superfamily protein